MQTNSLRGLLTEYREVMGVGRAALDRTIAGVLEKLSERLPVIFIDTLREQWNGLDALDQQIVQIERRLQAWMKQDEATRAIAAIPGVGLLTATAAVATMGHAKSFRSGREFAAWLGLVLGQTGSGGKVELLGISKCGDTYLRTLLIHGARSVLTHAKDPGEWVVDKFGAGFAQRAKAARRKPGSTWHLDESASRTQARACGAVLKIWSRPPGVGLQGQASSRPVLLRPTGVVVSDRGTH
jgi:transposase